MSGSPVRGRRGVALVCALVIAIGTAACGGGTDTTQDTSGDPVVEDTGAPETEDPGEDEEADDSGGNEPIAVELPGLPIGGDSNVVSETLQCADVGLTVPPEFPDWVEVTITGFRFDPEDEFEVSSEPCDVGTPSCLEDGFLLTVSQRCHVPVGWTGPTSIDSPAMWFSGQISCPPDRADECEALRAAVEAAGPQPANLSPAPEPEPEPEGEG